MRVAVIIGLLGFALGFILLAARAYIAAYVVLGLFAAFTYVPLLSVSSLFPRYRNTALAFVSGTIDSSAVVFVILAAMYKSGMSFTALIWLYICIVLAPLLCLAVFVLPHWGWDELFVMPAEDPAGPAVVGGADLAPEEVGALPAALPASASAVQGDTSELCIHMPTSAPSEERAATRSAAAHTSPKLSASAASAARRSDSCGGGSACSAAEIQDPAAPMPADQPAQPSFMAQAMSGAYAVYAVFSLINLFKFQFFLSTSLDQFKAITDNDTALSLSTALATTLAAGGLSVVLIGRTVDAVGVKWASAILCCLSALELTLGLIEIVGVQYGRFVVFILFRGATFSIFFAHGMWAFAPENFGRIVGAIFTLAGLINLIIPTLSKSLHGSFQTVNGVMLGITALQVILCAFMHPWKPKAK